MISTHDVDSNLALLDIWLRAHMAYEEQPGAAYVFRYALHIPSAADFVAE